MARRLRIFLSAGEASGDRYGAMLVQRLRALAPDAIISGIGGPRMAEAGMVLHEDMMPLATVGASQAVRNFNAFARVYRATIARLARERPDVFVPIDNPGFNLRLAQRAKELRIPVCYYVCPQVWAWGRWRVKRIAAVVDRVLALFPFEEEFYRAAGVEVRYVGHPLLDYIAAAQLDQTCIDRLAGSERPLVGLMPGSRTREVTAVFEPIARAAADVQRRVPSVRFVVACAQEKHVAPVRANLRAAGIEANAEILVGKTFEIMKATDLCMAVSGTVTLELAHFRRPMVIVYRSSRWGRPLRDLIIKSPYIGLVNVIAGREICPEFFLFNADPRPVADATVQLLQDPARLESTRDALDALIARLGESGASDRAARQVLELATARRPTPGST